MPRILIKKHRRQNPFTVQVNGREHLVHVGRVLRVTDEMLEVIKASDLEMVMDLLPEQDEEQHAKAVAAVAFLDTLTHEQREAAMDAVFGNKPADELRMDGPTLEEYVAAGYSADTYPPKGYAARGAGTTGEPQPANDPTAQPGADGSAPPATGSVDETTDLPSAGSQTSPVAPPKSDGEDAPKTEGPATDTSDAPPAPDAPHTDDTAASDQGPSPLV